MAYTSADLAALDAAIAAGEQTVRLGDRTVEYRSVADLILAREFVARQIDASTRASTRAAPRYQVASFGD